MTHSRIFPTVLVACALAASAGIASADIVQCLNEAGHTTFSDAACDAGLKTGQVKPQAAPWISKLAVAERTRQVRTARMNLAAQPMATDMAMMKVARVALTAVDAPSRLARKQSRSDSEQYRASSYWAWLVPLSAFRNTDYSTIGE